MFVTSGIFVISSILGVVLSEIVMNAIDRTIPDGVKSTGVSYKLMYGSEDLRIINEVVNEAENSDYLKKERDAYTAMDPLPAQDVKCLMSADKYCTDYMKEMKGVLIQAVKEDCKRCPEDQKEKAGRVVAAMLIHDPVAWKLFLTRTALQLTPDLTNKIEEFNYKTVGEPEIVNRNSKNMFIAEGSKVRVSRYAIDIVYKI